MDDKGTEEQNIHFLFNYFDIEHSGEVKEMSIVYLINMVGERLTKIQEVKAKKASSYESERAEKSLNRI